MKKHWLTLLLCVLIPYISIEQQSFADMTNTNSTNNHITIQTQYGNTVIELYPEKAPRHVERIKALASEGFYNGLKFHRAIPGFMVQTGDPLGNGTGGSKKPNLKAEFNDISHVKGVMSMARSSDPNSANSQFFIMVGDSSFLDGQYTAFGKVISGMEYIEQIKMGTSENNGMVSNPDTIIKMFVGQPETATNQ